MTNEDIENIRSKAQSCNLSIDLSPEASDIKHTQISVYDALQAFDDASDPTSVSIRTLMKLPFGIIFKDGRIFNYRTFVFCGYFT